MAGAGRLISSFPAGGVPSTLPGKPATDSIDRRWKSDAKRHDTSREEPFDEGARPWSSPRLPGPAPSGAVAAGEPTKGLVILWNDRERLGMSAARGVVSRDGLHRVTVHETGGPLAEAQGMISGETGRPMWSATEAPLDRDVPRARILC